MKTILVADDDKLSRLMVREMIEKMTDDFKVIIFSSGEEMLKEVDSLKPDAIICDIEMPGISGLEVCKKIKANKSRFIPIILITGRRLTREEIVQGYKAGCDDYIVKPFDSDELYARLNPILTIKRLQDSLLDKNQELEKIVNKRTEELAISRENYKAMFDNTSAGVCPADERGRIVDCNGSLEKILRLKCCEIVGKEFRDLFKSIDIEWLKEESFGNLYEDSIVYKAVTKDKRTIYISLVVKIFTYNEKISYLYIMNDITLNVESFNNLRSMTINLVTILTQIIEAKDPYTKGHCQRVSELAVKLGKFYGLNAKQLDRLKLGSLFHDIGKIGINEEILNKKGRLDDIEYSEIKKHTVIGESILGNVDFLQDLLPMIRGHHEKYDGTGYPDKKIGSAISVEERIIAIADVFDALTSSRPYRDPMKLEDALNVLKQSKGTQFDPELVDLFINKKVYN